MSSKKNLHRITKEMFEVNDIVQIVQSLILAVLVALL